jgi:hypothetical protein
LRFYQETNSENSDLIIPLLALAEEVVERKNLSRQIFDNIRLKRYLQVVGIDF